MAQISGSVRLRPTRIALLARPTEQHRAAIVRFFRLCTCLWGGRYNPVIPISKTVPSAWRRHLPRSMTGHGLANAYIKFFEPDMFVEAEDGLAAEIGLVSGTPLERRVINLAEFVKTTEARGSDVAFGLNAFDLYAHRYKRELQFVPRHKNRRFALVEKGHSRRAFFEAVVGVFPDDDSLEFIRRGYTDAFEPEVLKPTASSFLKMLQQKYETPFRVNLYSIDAEYRDGWDSTIFVFDSSRTTDLIDYWNVQLFKRVVPIDVAWVGECSDYLRDHITRTHRPLPGNHHGVMIHTTLEFGRSLDEKATASVRGLLIGTSESTRVPPQSCVLKRWYDQIWSTDWRGGGVQPRLAKLTAGEEEFEANVSPGQLSVQVKSLWPSFAPRYSFTRNAARWANVISLRDYGGESGCAILYPPNSDAPEFPRLRLGHPAIISREGIVLPQQRTRGREFLQLQTQNDAFIEWFKSHKIKAAPSDPGRNTDEVIRAVGGLRSCSLFADDLTLRLLEKMAKSIHETKAGTIEQYPDRTAGVREWKEVVKRRKGGGHAWFAPSLASFTERQVIRLGLAVRCPHCRQENWYDLSRVDYSVACDRCLRSFAFPQGDLNFNEKDWKFRLVGPFTHPNYAMGAYSTVLSLRVLSSTLHASFEPLTYSTGLLLEGGPLKKPLEVDYVAWYRPGEKFWIDPAPSLVFGESKSFGSKAFDARAIERLKDLATTFPGSFLVFSTLKAQLSSGEQEQLRRLATWGRFIKNGGPRALVVVLTATELFSPWSISSTWEEAGGKHEALTKQASVNMDDLWTLANLTQQVYLGMRSYDLELLERFKRRHKAQ